MNNILIITILLLLACNLAALIPAKEIGIRNYDGYQVLSVAAVNPEQHTLLKELQLSDNYDFWTNPGLGSYTDIMASPELFPTLITILDNANIQWTVKIQDAGKLAREQRIENDRRIAASGETRMTWDAYQRWSVIESWILSLANYSFVNVSSIGQSYEGRHIYMIKVSTGKLPNGDNKKVIFIDSNIHAREWIAGATGSWMLNELVTNSANYAEILNELDFYFVPYLNIDGYEYCHTTERFWRKTRSVNAGSTCRGCDPNRNFDFHFGGESTSTNPCSDIFSGVAPFSESETAALRDAIHAIQDEAEVWGYITLHSAAQMWLLQWGYTRGQYPDDYPELLSWGQESIAALTAVHGTRYVTGQAADVLYGVGGASDDWAKNEGIKFTSTVELRDNGYGFLLPPEQIIPSGEETWAALLKTAEIIINYNNNNTAVQK